MSVGRTKVDMYVQIVAGDQRKTLRVCNDGLHFVCTDEGFKNLAESPRETYGFGETPFHAIKEYFISFLYNKLLPYDCEYDLWYDQFRDEQEEHWIK